jgi:hypothetical protein
VHLPSEFQPNQIKLSKVTLNIQIINYKQNKIFSQSTKSPKSPIKVAKITDQNRQNHQNRQSKSPKSLPKNGQ